MSKVIFMSGRWLEVPDELADAMAGELLNSAEHQLDRLDAGGVLSPEERRQLHFALEEAERLR